MPDDALDDVIPGVSKAELVGAIRNLTKIPVSTLEDHDRFLIAVRSLVESRAQSGWPNEGADDVTVFVLAPYPRKLGQQFGATAVTDLIATTDAILGKLFFLNRDASSGRAMPLPVVPNEILEWLVDNKLDQLPVVTVHRNTKLLISRARGAAGDSRNDVIRDKAPTATLEEVEEALKLLHREFLITPSACPKGVWEPKRAAQYVPGVRPEKAIQRELMLVLTSWFQGVLKAEQEDEIKIGRIDVRLLRPDSEGTYSYWVVIELKVIKSCHNQKDVGDNAKKKKKSEPEPVTAGDNAEVVAEGIRQASAFGRSRHAEAFLDIYDLRKDKAENILLHAKVVEELGNRGFEPERCRVWPLYGSAAEARVAGYP